jgi:hypothetical protein
VNQAFKAWIEELETTDKPQGRGVLHRKSGELCCAGIACERAVAAGVLSDPRVENTLLDGGDLEVFVYDGADRVLPEAVQYWLGVDECATFPVDALPSELYRELRDMATGNPDEFAVNELKHPTDGKLSLVVLNDAGIPFKKIGEVARIAFDDRLTDAPGVVGADVD